MRKGKGWGSTAAERSIKNTGALPAGTSNQPAKRQARARSANLQTATACSPERRRHVAPGWYMQQRLKMALQARAQKAARRHTPRLYNIASWHGIRHNTMEGRQVVMIDNRMDR